MTEPSSRRAWAAWFVVLALTFAGQAAAVLALNFVANPRSEFPTHVLEPLVTSSRTQKTAAFLASDPPPDALILGSSRAWGVPPEALAAFGAERPFNFAVDRGTAHDALAIYRFALEEGRPPREILVAADEWFFLPALHEGWSPGRELGLRDVHEYAAPLARSYAWDYVKDSLRAVRYNALGFPPGVAVFQEDGSIRHAPAEEDALDAPWARASSGIAGEIEQRLAPVAALYAEHDRPDPRAVAALDALLAEARAHGTRVVLYISPMHPEAAARLPSPAYESFLDATREILLARCDASVSLHDVADPDAFGADLDDFTDGWHFGGATAERLVGHVHDPGTDLCA